MSLLDWLIVLIPTTFVVGMGIYSMRYVRSVADFLSAGRVARRYVLTVGDVANALAIISLAAYVEVHYKTGFALVFWNYLLLPLTLVMSLYGYVTYRFRETKAMSLGQFLEMRYNRKFRVFASGLRSVSEMLANMIMPAIAARFFIYFLDLPHKLNIFGFEISTFIFIVLICLILAISIIYCGGTLALLVTDSIQGMILFPLMVVFVVFILYKFNWYTEIVPVMLDRVPNESFLSPYDISNLRDFNIFTIFLGVVVAIVHRASWIGAGYTTAAKSPHEQKMAGLLGTWRGALNVLFYVLIALCIIVVMNHKKYAPDAHKIRVDLARHISEEVVSDANRADFIQRVQNLPIKYHEIGVDEPQSQANNLDTPMLNTVHQALKEYNGEVVGNTKFQEYRTLYHQLMLANGTRELLPPIILGLFALLLVLAMISTDDTRIFSASLTFTQDVVVPLCPKPLTPKQHIMVIRLVSIGVGIFFLIGSSFMSQLDYINLFVTLMTSMWMGGCAPVMMFGLYSRFGNSAGAFASLISGMLLAFAGIFVLRNWSNIVYPFLEANEWHVPVGAFLETISSPLNPIVEWKMNAIKCPINAYEHYMLTMIITFFIFCIVSYFTQKEPFNLERMLHRGIYNTDGENKVKESWSLRNVWNKLIGITPEYTTGDKVLAWSVVIYSIFYKFCGCFILIIIWNMISPWPVERWGTYFYITTLLVPGTIAFVSTFWFGIGGVVDLTRLFRDLENRVINPLDNGTVDGHVSLADKEKFEKLEVEATKTQK